MVKVDAALALAAKGFKVFPIKPGGKAPPLLNGWPQKATSDADEVRAMWAAVPEANIGVHCAGMAVVDVDTKKNGDATFDQLEMLHGFPDTLVVRTPTGGKHLYYRTTEEVGNGVDTLGAGIDIRGTGGYVVGPGSEVPAGTYVVESGEGVADAPAWLEHRLARFSPKPPKEASAAPVADAQEDVVARAREWLISQAPAIQGQGGDAHTFKTACALRDRGVSEQQAVSLLSELWNHRCEPPWPIDDLIAKVANAYRYAENEPGTLALTDRDFPEPDLKEATTVAKSRTVVHSMDELVETDERAAAGYLVKGLLQRHSYAEVYGESGAGKTFVTLDMAYHVAAGREWMGHRVHQGPVLYLAYEGMGGMRKRLKALRHQYQQKAVPLYLVAADYNLRELAGRQQLGEAIRQLPSRPVLIVIDTFALALMGGDENSAQDVGAFNIAVAGLQAATGACVLIVHHSGKDKNRGARGSSALRAAIDTELEVDQYTLYSRKQRDIELALPIGFKLTPVPVGKDEDGEELTSCVVMPAAAAKVEGAGKLSKPAQQAFQVLCDMAPDNKPVDVQAWKTKCIEEGACGKTAFYGAVKRLERAEMISRQDKTVTRRLE